MASAAAEAAAAPEGDAEETRREKKGKPRGGKAWHGNQDLLQEQMMTALPMDAVRILKYREEYSGARDEEVLAQNLWLRDVPKGIPQSNMAAALYYVAGKREESWKLANERLNWAKTQAKRIRACVRDISQAVLKARKNPDTCPGWVKLFMDAEGEGGEVGEDDGGEDEAEDDPADGASAASASSAPAAAAPAPAAAAAPAPAAPDHSEKYKFDYYPETLVRGLNTGHAHPRDAHRLTANHWQR